ncbi:hypothetical protein [Halosimplex salinum]|uniref:hypothetical protein n=1 Tax=Halosimplex salinum TaxID=1710538 RepID=UPI000F477461|nr:hypothetical protein [Halosimplex salinum]
MTNAGGPSRENVGGPSRETGGSEATHEVVCRGDPADAVAADTRLVSVGCEFGDEALLATTSDDLLDRSPHTQRVLDDELERLPDGAGLRGDGPTWRATLPGDADALRRGLTVDTEESDGDPLGDARWRVWDVETVEVRRDDEWIYRSVPHHSQMELDGEGAPGLVERATERLAELPCAVVPTGPVATWEDGGELDHRSLRFETGSGVSLRHVRRVAVDRDRRELVVDWEPLRERVEREPSRVLRTVLRAFTWTLSRVTDTESPPRRLAFADEASFDRAAEGIEIVRDRVGYEFDVVDA